MPGLPRVVMMTRRSARFCRREIVGWESQQRYGGKLVWSSTANGCQAWASAERLGDVPHLPPWELGDAGLCSVLASAGSRPAIAATSYSLHPRLPHHRFLDAVLKTDLFLHRSSKEMRPISTGLPHCFLYNLCVNLHLPHPSTH